MKCYSLLGLFLVLSLAVLTTATGDTCPGIPSNQDTRIILLLENNQLLWFSPNDQFTGFRTIQVTGINGTLLAIDIRPNGRTLWGLSDNQGLYRIELVTGEATLISTLSNRLKGRNIGMDFNPTVDRLRLVSGRTNFRVNVDTGAVIVDGNIEYAMDDVNEHRNAQLTGVAYTNSFQGSSSTTLYGIDVQNRNNFRLVSINPPNNGTLNTIGNLGICGDRIGGFDILTSHNGCNTALFVTDSRFYFINLNSGQATPVWPETSQFIDRYLCDLDVVGLAIL